MRSLLAVVLLALSTSGCAVVARSALATGSRPDTAQILANADSNGDGKITRAEFTAARGAAFAKFDRNGDGRISSSEFVNGPSLLFDRADTNRDGVVDEKELAAFRAVVAARRAQ